MSVDLKCPKCGKSFSEVNGLYVYCKSCNYMDDSTLGQIVNSKDFEGVEK